MSRFFTRYFTSVLVFMFALPISTLLFGVWLRVGVRQARLLQLSVPYSPTFSGLS